MKNKNATIIVSLVSILVCMTVFFIIRKDISRQSLFGTYHMIVIESLINILIMCVLAASLGVLARLKWAVSVLRNLLIISSVIAIMWTLILSAFAILRIVPYYLPIQERPYFISSLWKSIGLVSLLPISLIILVIILSNVLKSSRDVQK